MIDYILAAIIVVLLGYIYLKDQQHNKQINRLINAVIAKQPQDLVNLNLSEATKIERTEPPLGPVDDDLIPMSEASDELFAKITQASGA